MEDKEEKYIYEPLNDETDTPTVTFVQEEIDNGVTTAASHYNLPDLSIHNDARSIEDVDYKSKLSTDIISNISVSNQKMSQTNNAEAVAEVVKKLMSQSSDVSFETSSYLTLEDINDANLNGSEMNSDEECESPIVSPYKKRKIKECHTGSKMEDYYLSSCGIDVTNFLQSSVNKTRQKYMIFATHDQLIQLGAARTWFINDAVKIFCQPFVRLFSVNAYLKYGESIKQHPLAFVFMSNHKKPDYIEVFRAIWEILPADPQLRRIVCKYDKPLWLAIREEYPGVDLRGCLFHWSQMVDKIIVNFGLQPAYIAKGPTYRFLKLILSLPYLPAKDIKPEFENLCSVLRFNYEEFVIEDTGISDIKSVLQYVLDYIKNMWIENKFWKIANWSVFGMPFRTVNEVENWKGCLDLKTARGRAQFNKIVPMLLRHAKLVSLSMARTSDSAISRHQSKDLGTRSGQVAQLGKSLFKQEISPRQFLRLISLSRSTDL